MPHIDPSTFEPHQPDPGGDPATATPGQQHAPAPPIGPSHSPYAQSLLDHLHQAVGEVLTCQRQPDPDTRIDSAATSLLAYLLLTISSGPALAYRTAVQALARERAVSGGIPVEDRVAIYARTLGELAAGTIAELLAEVRQTPGVDAMVVLSTALEVYQDLARNDTD
ncbi:MAG: hypothetical protein ACRDP6_01320 [Actinoallomurus sp.]